jgi:1-acyl-sn-glycerol-3-phosphate acyltransferase
MDKITFTPQRILIWLLFWPFMVIYRLLGWRFANHVDIHTIPKAVIVAAPHTTNWDFMMIFPMIVFYARMPATMVKDQYARGLWKYPAKLGNIIPIERSATHNLVEQVVKVLNERERLIVVITPEGTRKYTEYWKSGFYHIALKANVPIVVATIDYGKKETGMKVLLHPSGDIEKDMAIIREALKDVTALYPENFGPVQVRPHTSEADKATLEKAQ